MMFFRFCDCIIVCCNACCFCLNKKELCYFGLLFLLSGYSRGRCYNCIVEKECYFRLACYV